MAKQKEVEFVNPFAEGVSYKQFLEALGSSTVEEYCKDKLTQEQIEWLVNDLKHLKNK